MFLSRNKKNNVYPYKLTFYYIKVGFKGVRIIKACFRDAPSITRKLQKACVISEDSDQTARIRRLIRVFAGRINLIVGFVVYWLICGSVYAHKNIDSTDRPKSIFS